MTRACILLSTCDRYRSVAEWTQSRIAKEWPGHPPLRVCGVGDDRDWMSVTLSGVQRCLDEGFDLLYLILDDHPPVGACRADILNEILPAAAKECGAVNIGLLGFGQRRGREGTIEQVGDLQLLRNDFAYRWKFSLHPALWSAERLRDLLQIRIGQFAPEKRTPWNFERHRDQRDGPVSPDLTDHTYRINGTAAACGWQFLDSATRQPALLAFDLWRFLLRITRGQAARDKFDRRNLWLYHYYRGPYPILWSGAVRGGEPSRDFEMFLNFTGRRSMLREWRGVKERFALC